MLIRRRHFLAVAGLGVLGSNPAARTIFRAQAGHPKSTFVSWGYISRPDFCAEKMSILQRSGLAATAFGAGILLCSSGAWGQVGLTNAIPPTVTRDMGDVGGKFYGRTPDPRKTRRYFIAAEPQLWDYAPEGRDVMCGKPFPPPVAAKRQGGKVRYVQYTDESFAARVIENPRLGILGPVLRGVVGEYVAVTFLNRTARPLSMHPHGLKYDKDSEGAYYQPKPGLGAAVAEGAKFTYVWHLDESSGPMSGEPSSKGWLYHSHVNGDEEVNLGLVGFIIVTDPQRARPDGTPIDVEREEAALFMIFDESGLGDAEREAAEYGNLPGAGLPRKTWAQAQELTKQGERHAINGYIFGNAPGLEMIEGERVRWYVFGLGSEDDFHAAHWHGLRVVEEGRRRTDVVELLPATMKVADMVADNPGTWLLHCHVAEHMMEGMFARVVVHNKGVAPSAAAGPAYFGLTPGQQSLQIKRAGAVLDLAPNAAEPCALSLEGTVSVFHAYSVFTQPIQFGLGGKTVTFKPDRRGGATVADGSWRVKNASQYGVVYGGLMEFEVTLNGPAWLDELKKLGLMKGAAPAANLPVSIQLQVGEAHHAATAVLIPRLK
jgi:FtsP/CotA-like multicopper oxidase with cupredoxin domain